MDYWLLRDGEKYGPYSEEQLVQFAERGNLSGSDRLWHQDLEGWEAPLLVLPCLELLDSGQQGTGASSPGASPGPQQRQELPVQENEPRRRRASFLRSGLTWIPLFSGLLVGALGFQAFLVSVARAELSKHPSQENGWFASEFARFSVNGGVGLLVGQEDKAFRLVSWGAGILVGVVNGLSFGAILGWLAALIGLRGSLRARVVICSVLGGAIGLLLNSFLGTTPLAFAVGFLGLKEGLLLGACFAAVHSLDEFRAQAVGRRKLEEGV